MELTMEDFQIHQQLLADCHRLGRLSVCHVLLHRNATLPWFILVPEATVTDLLDLPADSLDRVMAEAAAVSAIVKNDLGYPKVNFGAIGNLVPQLHLHVIGRRPGDACWPAPVWGHLNHAAEYTSHQVTALRAKFAAGPESQP
jgi:diadenosine tetraphosphate (Ap4A) HIT family hydrolase